MKTKVFFGGVVGHLTCPSHQDDFKRRQLSQKKTLVFQVGPFEASWVEWHTGFTWQERQRLLQEALVSGSCLVKKPWLSCQEGSCM